MVTPFKAFKVFYHITNFPEEDCYVILTAVPAESLSSSERSLKFDPNLPVPMTVSLSAYTLHTNVCGTLKLEKGSYLRSKILLGNAHQLHVLFRAWCW